MTWRELKVFITHLPPGSATHRAMYGEAAEWTPTTHVVASLWDAFTQVHTPKNKTHHPYPRPELPDDN
jgi:hypothetical protein